MDWKDIAAVVAKEAPALGAVIAGPAGAGIGALIAATLGCANTPSDVQQALLTSPDAAVKLKTIEAQVTIAQIAAAATQVQAVNQTLQADAGSTSWWPKNHHAFETSFTLLMVATIYIGMPMLKIPVPTIDQMVWVMIGGILGVTAWQNGQVSKLNAGT